MPIINPGTGGGSPGPQGPQGIQGFPGFGFDGESGEDGFSIPGPAGAQGSQGIQGVPGINGSQGIPGEDGLSGEDSFIPGPQGLAGTNGTNGTIGRDGARGLDGEDGSNGDDFWPGFNIPLDDPLEQISRIQDKNLRILPSYSAVVVGPYTINTGKTLTLESGARFQIFQGAPDAKAVVFASQTSLFTSSSINDIESMAGLGATNSNQVITPKTSGILLVVLVGSVTQTTGLNNVIKVRLYYGIGTPPAQGVVPPGGSVQVGNMVKVGTGSTGIPFTFTIPIIVRRLLVNTTYWFDASLATPNATATNLTLDVANFVAIELPS